MHGRGNIKLGNVNRWSTNELKCSSTRKGGTMKHIARSFIELLLVISIFGLVALAQNVPASGDSLADYARNIRKDNGAKPKPKVFDNDNLPTNDKLSIVGPAEATAPVEDTTAAKPEEPASSAASSDGAPAAGGSKTSPEGKPASKSETTNAKSETSSPASESKTAETTSAETKTAEASAGASNKPNEDAAKQAEWKQWSEKLASQKEQIDLTARELDVLQREYQIRAAAMYGDAGSRLRNSADWDKQDAQYKQQIADKQKALDDAKQKLDDMQEDARKAGVPASEREP